MKRSMLRIPIVVGMVVSLCVVALNFSAGVTSGAPAQHSDTSWLFFPWIPNGETMDGAGPWYGSVTVQNLEDFRVAIAFADSAAGGGSNGTTLEPHAAQTFSAGDLSIKSPGGGASVAATWDFSPPGQTQRLVGAGICSYKYDAVTDTLVHQSSGGVDMLGQPVDSRYLSSIVVTQTINGNEVTYRQGVDFNVIDVQLSTGPTVGALDWSPSGQEPGTGTPFDVTFVPSAPAPVTDNLIKGAANTADNLKHAVDTSFPVFVNDISYVQGTDFLVTDGANTIDWSPSGGKTAEPLTTSDYTVGYTTGGPVAESETLTKGNPNTVDNLTYTVDANYAVTVTQSFPYTQGSDFNIVSASSGSSIDWSPTVSELPEPPTYAHYQVSYEPVGNPNIVCRSPEIGGVEKQMSPSALDQARTSSAQTSVDGYTAVAEGDVPWGPASKFCHDLAQSDCNNVGLFSGGVGIDPTTFDGHSYLPIIQTNNSWDSIIHLTNVDASSSTAAVTVTLYSAGTGAFDQSMGSWNYTIGRGESKTIDIKADLHIPDEWIGSAWITSDYAIVASTSRVKPTSNMAMTNIAAPSLPAPGPTNTYSLYAPLIFVNYNLWNTGVNITNLSEKTNHVTLTVYDGTSKVVVVDTVDVAPKGMKYIYFPDIAKSINAQNLVGTAILTSSLPFHSVIDEVKYLSSGPGDQGQDLAMSYVATAAGANPWGPSPYGAPARLSLPLVQRGDNAGHGDTSGINLFNPDPSHGVTVDVTFYYQSGAAAQPTLNGPLVVTLGPLSAATIYTPSFSEMDPGFQGSAVITPMPNPNEAPTGTIYGISNNVNYDVPGDGGSVFNLLNQWGSFRFFCQQTDLGVCSAG